jgi:hypothetical protein
MTMLLINVYHEGQILNTLTAVGYDICVVCTFSTEDTVNIHDLKRQIHVDLELLTSYFNLIIRARINTIQLGSGDFFYSLFWIVSKKI